MEIRKGWMALSMSAALVAAGASAWAGEPRQVNVAVVVKQDAAMKFEPIVLGDLKTFVGSLGNARLQVLAHTDDAIDGDVINLQLDVLRPEAGADIGDYGINCSLSFKDETTGDSPDYLIGGLCHLLRTGRGKDLKLKAVVPMTHLPDTAQGVDAWVKAFEDPKTGVAIYANVSRN